MSVKKKLFQVPREAIHLSIVHIQLGVVLMRIFIFNMGSLNGNKKWCFRENTGTSTYYITGIRWELQGHTSGTLAEACGCLCIILATIHLTMFVSLSKQLKFSVFVAWKISNLQLQDGDQCLYFVFCDYLCLNNQYVYLVIPSLFCF